MQNVAPAALKTPEEVESLIRFIENKETQNTMYQIGIKNLAILTMTLGAGILTHRHIVGCLAAPVAATALLTTAYVATLFFTASFLNIASFFSSHPKKSQISINPILKNIVFEPSKFFPTVSWSTTLSTGFFTASLITFPISSMLIFKASITYAIFLGIFSAASTSLKLLNIRLPDFDELNAKNIFQYVIDLDPKKVIHDAIDSTLFTKEYFESIVRSKNLQYQSKDELLEKVAKALITGYTIKGTSLDTSNTITAIHPHLYSLETLRLYYNKLTEEQRKDAFAFDKKFEVNDGFLHPFSKARDGLIAQLKDSIFLSQAVEQYIN